MSYSYRIRKPYVSHAGLPLSLMQSREDVYATFYNGTKYQLRVINQAEFDLAAADLPRVNGVRPIIFEAKCWWADGGGNWWVGASAPSARDAFGELVGPFSSVDDALVYIKLLG